VSTPSTTTAKVALLRNPHPGEILLEEFLKPIALSQNALARAVHVVPRKDQSDRDRQTRHYRRRKTADADFRLARCWPAGCFRGLQMDHDLMQPATRHRLRPQSNLPARGLIVAARARSAGVQ
jgi:antitoxin HigA-1